VLPTYTLSDVGLTILYTFPFWYDLVVVLGILCLGLLLNCAECAWKFTDAHEKKKKRQWA
jgi:hypothetical protein